jgi:hypothetical protein
MSFLPQAFISNLNTKDGLAKPSRFQIILPIPKYINDFSQQTFIEQLINLPGTIISDITNLISNGQDSDQSRTTNSSVTRYLSLQCENAELPGKILQTQEVKIYGPTFKVPYQTQFQDMNLTFLCSNEFYERKLFERWMEAIHPSDTNNLRYPKGTNTRYLTNIKVIQYDDFVRQIYAVELIDAFPIGMSPQALSWGEQNFHRLTVQFAYQRYVPIYRGNYNLTEFILEVFGSKASSWIDKTTGDFIAPVGKAFAKYF